MPTAKKSALNLTLINLTLNGKILALSAALLFAISNVLHADDISATNNMPDSEDQGSSVKENPVEKTQGKVARAIFTSEIIDREPANDLTEINNTTDRVYFFTDLRNLTGQIITHQWEFNDKVMAEVKFKVGGGPRWRVYSSKNLLPEWTGIWTVIVSDESGQTLNASVFNYTQATTTVEATAEPEQQASE